MLRPWDRVRSFAVALLVLASLLTAAGADLLPHTDDGCQTEVHCVACRSAFSRAVPVSLAAPAPTELASSGEVVPLGVVEREETAGFEFSSRGPPRG